MAGFLKNPNYTPERLLKSSRGFRLYVALGFLVVLAVVRDALADWQKTYDWTAMVAVSSVVALPSNSQRVYAFVGNTPWILYSDDGGISWQKSPPVVSHGGVQSITVVPVDGTIYVGVVSDPIGMYKSTDGGRSFVPRGGGIFSSGVSGMAIDRHEPNTLYATRAPTCTTTCTPGGVVKSIDAGLTWFGTGRVDSSNRSIAIDPNNSLIVYTTGIDIPVSRQTAGLYRTMDGGSTWPAMFPGYTYIRYLTVDALSRVYTITELRFETLLLRSTNQGERWERLRISVPPPPAEFGEGAWPNLTAVVADPRRPETIYVSSYTHGVFVSYDDGATWQPLGEIPDRFVNTIAVTPDGVVLAAAQTGIWRYVTPPPPLPRRRAVASRGAQ